MTRWGDPHDPHQRSRTEIPDTPPPSLRLANILIYQLQALYYRTSHKNLKSLPFPLGARSKGLYNVRMYTNLSNPPAVPFSARTFNPFTQPHSRRGSFTPLSTTRSRIPPAFSHLSTQYSAPNTSSPPILSSLSEQLCAARLSKNHASFTPGLPRPVGGEHTTQKVASPASQLLTTKTRLALVAACSDQDPGKKASASDDAS